MANVINIPSESHFEYALTSFPVNSSDLLYDVDLTINRALSFVDESVRDDYRNMWAWFAEGGLTGEIGSRRFGQRLPGVKIPHVAQRGIHVPSKQRYAASVTSSGRGIYSDDGFDGTFQNIGDGTWLMFYSAHRNNTGGDTATTWNAGLLNCLYDGVPVGVFVAQANGLYYRALAYVEAYDPGADMFTLHGPVTFENESAFVAPEREDLKFVEGGLSNPDLQEMSKDTRKRVVAESVRRVGQEKFKALLMAVYDGSCAVTGCETPETLQGAHILSYRGAQCNIAANGILLRADVHLLYDRYLLSIEPRTHRVVVDRGIADDEYRELSGSVLRMPSDALAQPDERYLNAHHRRFLEMRQAM